MKENTLPSSKETVSFIWKLLESVTDPEVPVLSVIDLGIVRNVQILASDLKEGNLVEITITPTYSGCPAMDMIGANIRMALLQNGFSNIKIITVLSPAWTTDWMSEAGKGKLKAYGIAPPMGKNFDQQSLENTIVQCPNCDSQDTRLVSEFSSTSCKAFYVCNTCKEPFEHFKCH